MQRVSHRRVGAAMQYAVRRYLEQTPMGKGVPGFCAGATVGQIKAAAKKIVNSGKLPSAMPQMVRRGASR